MKTPLPLLLLAVVITGCDGDPNTDNGQVTVRNRTDDTITVFYKQEAASRQITSDCACETTDIVYARYDLDAHIPSHSSDTLTVDSYGWWDGDITVEYYGLYRTYDLDFNLFGFDSVEVFEEDFLPAGNG